MLSPLRRAAALSALAALLLLSCGSEQLGPPDDEDGKAADKAQADLERQIDTAPAGNSVRA